MLLKKKSFLSLSFFSLERIGIIMKIVYFCINTVFILVVSCDDYASIIMSKCL